MVGSAICFELVFFKFSKRFFSSYETLPNIEREEATLGGCHYKPKKERPPKIDISVKKMK